MLSVWILWITVDSKRKKLESSKAKRQERSINYVKPFEGGGSNLLIE